MLFFLLSYIYTVQPVKVTLDFKLKLHPGVMIIIILDI